MSDHSKTLVKKITIEHMWIFPLLQEYFSYFSLNYLNG